ncbi:MAG: hypothetical protein M4579_000542 [Chaenotheca gracillima]|nr:MAG: hypothetical protein M4579_000542 [Chaenotheca gracillima]
MVHRKKMRKEPTHTPEQQIILRQAAAILNVNLLELPKALTDPRRFQEEDDQDEHYSYASPLSPASRRALRDPPLTIGEGSTVDEWISQIQSDSSQDQASGIVDSASDELDNENAPGESDIAAPNTGGHPSELASHQRISSSDTGPYLRPEQNYGHVEYDSTWPILPNYTSTGLTFNQALPSGAEYFGQPWGSTNWHPGDNTSENHLAFDGLPPDSGLGTDTAIASAFSGPLARRQCLMRSMIRFRVVIWLLRRLQMKDKVGIYLPQITAAACQTKSQHLSETGLDQVAIKSHATKEPSTVPKNAKRLGELANWLPAFDVECSESGKSCLKWSKRWPDGKVGEISEWASAEIKTIYLTQGFTPVPIEMKVRKFVPVEGDLLERPWFDGTKRKAIKVPNYAIADMRTTVINVQKHLDATLWSCIQTILSDHDPIIRETYVSAYHHRFSQAPDDEKKLVKNALRLWYAIRTICRSVRIDGEETLGMSPTTDTSYPLFGEIPIPPVMGAQYMTITVSTILEPLRKSVLAQTQKTFASMKPKNWFAIYLTTFIFLHSCSLVTQHAYEYSRKHGVKVRQQSKSQDSLFAVFTDLHEGPIL